ncbi:hypothetical protein H072_8414 [Dactylellina haptotyla CBS 200.50]|uniref:Uncharacterized protein n=1 Tax=Dactylellina haptotyla (strain CBS 200.50) TaxID=1284197 RepID=S8BRP5_DACHA|nr:hypothetical protein H072_8414 [Dactylellina haptotyla CBS 200.50]
MHGQELCEAFNGNYFNQLRHLLYSLSNNIFDAIELDRLLDRIAEISVQLIFENILPLLILRGKIDFESYVSEAQGVIPIKWYTAFAEIDLRRPFGYFFRNHGEAQVLYEKYRPDTAVIRQFLKRGIAFFRPVPTDNVEAGILLACAVKHQIFELDHIAALLPASLSLASAEIYYKELYAKLVLESSWSPDDIPRFIDLGFRRYMHGVFLKAVLLNDFETALAILPYSRLKLSSDQITLLNYCSKTTGSEFLVGHVIGHDNFAELLQEFEMEGSKPVTSSFADLLIISRYLKSVELREYLLEFLNSAFSGYSLWQIPSILLDAIFSSKIRLPEFWLERYHMRFPSARYGYDDDEILEWPRRFIEFGLRLSGHSPIPEGRLLDAISDKDIRQVEFLIKLRVNLNSSGGSERPAPLVAALSTASGHESCHGYSSYDYSPMILTPYGVGDDIQIFKQLLVAGADTQCLANEFNLETEQKKASTERRTKAVEKLHAKEYEPSGYRGSDSPLKCAQYTPTRYGNYLRSIMFRPPIFTICSSQMGTKYLGECQVLWSVFRMDQIVEEVEILLKDLKNTDNKAELMSIIFDSTMRANIPAKFTVLQILTLINDTHLLRCFFEHCSEDTSDQLSHEKQSSPSPLQIAAAWQNFENIKILVKHNADVREPAPLTTLVAIAPDSELKETGGTALQYAVEGGQFDIAEYLVEHGADIHAVAPLRTRDSDWPSTALESAIKLRRLDFIALFLSVDIGAVDIALATAERYGMPKIAQWIRSEWMNKDQKEFEDRSEQGYPVLQHAVRALHSDKTRIDTSVMGFTERNFIYISIDP